MLVIFTTLIHVSYPGEEGDTALGLGRGRGTALRGGGVYYLGGGGGELG